MSKHIKHLLFDNDGTIVDSEIIAQRTMLNMLAQYGFQMNEQEYSHRFPGLLDRDILHILKQDHGLQLPDDFIVRLHEAHHEGFHRSLRAIPGMTNLFRNLKMPKSMVSNGSIRHVERCLRQVRLLSSVNGHIFSAEQVEKPKPHPDVYHFALDKLGLKAHQSLAIEDSPTGVAAAKEAGLQTVGFLGAAHIHDGHGEKLIAAGADHLVPNTKALGQLFESLGLH